jgi:uncharacterized tellurite resistance protein B-like protein
MLRAIRRAFAAAPEESVSASDQLRLAVAVLLHEARRADYAHGRKEAAAAERALAAVKREFSQEERVRLVEHLWRVSFAEGGLDPYEDHYVRKIAHLLYVPNTQAMLARNRARDG